MDPVDRDLEKAETDAQLPADAVPTAGLTNATSTYETKEQNSSDTSNLGPTRRSVTSSRSSVSVVREAMNLSRYNTGRDLDRHPTALSRIDTHRTQHSNTVGRSASANRDSRKPLPNFGGGKDYPPDLPERDAYVVEFDGHDDPLHPMNWTFRKKMFTGLILGYTTLVSAFASSIFSAATAEVAAYFGVSTEVGILGLSFYVLGFATGPICWAPLSELKGRKIPLMLSMLGFSIFSIGTATGKDLQTVLITRFFAGVFASCPLAVVGAVFTDIFDNEQRGLALTVFSMTVFCGPIIAPFIGGFMVMNPHMGWRWTAYLPSIMGFIAFGLITVFYTESYPPIVLVSKASALRRRTRNWGIHAKQEEIEVDLQELIQKNFSRPLRLLFTEPIVLLLSLYMGFIYGLLYLFLTAYPIVFQQIHGFNPGVGGLPYFGMVGGMLSAGLFIVFTQKSYVRKLRANNGVPIPEWRLPPVIIGGVAFAAGLFWFGWSGYKPTTHWIVPTLSGLLTGFGLLAIFLQSLNYLVDAYLMFAASAIAANTFLRSIAGAVFPLFSQYMFRALKVNWSGTLLGCVAVLLVPIPIVFLKYGARIRQKSRFAPTIQAKPGAGDDAE